MIISSLANAQIKNVIQLQTKSKARKEQRCFIVEGQRLFLEVPKDRRVKSYIAESYFNKMTKHNENMPENFEIVADNIFKNMSDTVTPQGILSIVRQNETNLTQILENRAGQKNQCFLILEDIQDPGNLGTIIRTAEGAGVSGVILSRNTVDIYNPKVVRSTMGSLFRVPFVYVDDIVGTVLRMKETGILAYAAHLGGQDYYYEKDYTIPSAFMIGNEGNGLSDSLTFIADGLIKIPMCGKVESLNAANAATILMYEVLRQNKIKK